MSVKLKAHTSKHAMVIAAVGEMQSAVTTATSLKALLEL